MEAIFYQDPEKEAGERKRMGGDERVGGERNGDKKEGVE